MPAFSYPCSKYLLTKFTLKWIQSTIAYIYVFRKIAFIAKLFITFWTG